MHKAAVRRKQIIGIVQDFPTEVLLKRLASFEINHQPGNQNTGRNCGARDPLYDERIAEQNSVHAGSLRGIHLLVDHCVLISDASVFQFMANPRSDEQGIRLLATALMLNGIAMEIAGSSRPASGSEHLISHALDMTGARRRLHGLQTGTAAYLVSSLQGGSHHEAIGELFGRTGFWESVRKEPFSKEEWKIAVERAPSVKEDFYTILSDKEAWPEFARMIAHDPALVGCFE